MPLRAPSRLSASPKPRLPTRVKSCRGPPMSIPIVSPTSKPARSIVAASSINSVGPSGGLPSRMVNWLGPPDHEVTNVGGPVVGRSSPSESRI